MNTCTFDSDPALTNLPDINITLNNIPNTVREILNTPHNKALLYSSYRNGMFQRSNAQITIRTQNILNRCLKEIVLHNLKYHTVARLFKSTYGVGVVAIKPIAKGTRIFDTTLGCLPCNPVMISKNEIGNNEGLETLLNDFLVPSLENGELHYPVPMLGLNGIDISFFLNHSEDCNVESISTGNCDMSVYAAKRDIQIGEELTLDYKKFGNVIRQTMPFLSDGGAKQKKKQIKKKK